MRQTQESNEPSIRELIKHVKDYPGVDKKLLDEFTVYDPVHGAMLKDYFARNNLNWTAAWSGTGAFIALHMFSKTKGVGAAAVLRFGLFAGLSGVALGAQVAKIWYPYNHQEVKIARPIYKEWAQKRASGESAFGLSFT